MAEADSSLFVAGAPGCRRDIRRGTDLAAELPYFNEEQVAARFLEGGVTPILGQLPRSCRLVDLGGADGFLAQQAKSFLESRGHIVEATVVDANVAALMRAQRRGLSVVPSNLDRLRVDPADLMLMRLVNHYNGAAKQRAILKTARSNLAEGGHLVIQAETGSQRLCAFRTLIARLLQDATPDRALAEGCQWSTSRTLCRMLSATGFDCIVVDDAFLVVEMPLRTALELAWNRFVGDDVEVSGAERSRLVAAALELATRRPEKWPLDELIATDGGAPLLRSRHSLIVAGQAGLRHHDTDGAQDQPC